MRSKVTKRARRSDALFYGESSRRELCNMVARLEAELEDVKKLAEKMQDSRERLMEHMI